VHALRDNIRDSLYTKHIPNFRVLCPNRMVGVGQRNQVPSDEEAARTAALWGANPVHPSAAAYRCMAEQLEKDILNSDARYTNPAKQHGQKRPRIDLSLGRAD
jgi:lysophospholipase L1-like esterase